MGLEKIVEELHVELVVFYDENRFGHARSESPEMSCLF
jgi:hypothetical protein